MDSDGWTALMYAVTVGDATGLRGFGRVSGDRLDAGIRAEVEPGESAGDPVSDEAED